MRIHIFSFIPFCLILFRIDILSVSSQCLSDQQSILIQFKNTINFNSSLSTKIVTWNKNTDCCGWKGVSCGTDGHVIGLDLTNESISGGIENSSALFSLRYLCRLNLAVNNFNYTQIPPAIASLTNLEYLNLSRADFSGQIPVEMSNMIRLVTLDLSTVSGYYMIYNVDRSGLLELEIPNLTMLVRNLKELTELHLDGVNISAQGYDWCQVISFSLPKLKVLSLFDCSLSGPIDASFAKLQSLSVIQLSGNDLSSPVPEFLSNFTNLAILKLSNCNLNGRFPGKILQVPSLETLDLSENVLLNGFLPIFPQNASLQTLVLSFTNFSHTLPDSIGNLKMLSRLHLRYSNFSGQIPPSIASLTQLVHLDLSLNYFSGPIPSFHKSESLTDLDLSFNGLSGPIPNSYFKGHLNLEYVYLEFNALNGSIPSSLFGLSSLQYIVLSNNNFHGLLPNFSNPLPSLLRTLDLSSNRLEGPIPNSFFDLTSLDFLILSNNLLNGTVELEAFSGLGNLTHLDLSYNNLSIEIKSENPNLSLSPQLESLKLVSCKLQHFPNLKKHSFLGTLDLSNNQISGEIPSWIWKEYFGYLNLSHNLLDNFQQPYEIPNYLLVIDLHSNRLQGEIPILPNGALVLDLSDNQFNSSLPIDIGYSLNYTYFFSISNNGITGRIPDSICTAIGLEVLDLSNNHLTGTIPSCLVQLTESLGVLNLGKNNLSGNIPRTFTTNCSLATLDLHGNHLEGNVPESLENCSMLEVLELGKNSINDTFPCFLNKCTNLRVLSLGSNKLHGNIRCKGATQVWSKLQIINLASNYFTGQVPRNFLFNLSAMIADEDGQQSKLNHLHFQPSDGYQFDYVDEVTVVIKGNEIELVRILTIFTSIDLSNNMFSGEIPNTIGELNALHILNMSHNAFRGSIPSSIGNLKQLESLDLSMNDLAGMIPIELDNLTFLSFLNLSYNYLLEGRIPAGPQLQTFTETSFEGNKRLCGIQVNVSCVAEHAQDSSSPPTSEEGDGKSEIDGLLISFEVGIVVGLATVIAPLVLSRRWNKWYFDQVDRIVAAKVYRYYQRKNQETKKQIRFA